MWCLVMTHMVKVMRYDRIGRARRNMHAPARGGKKLRCEVRSDHFESVRSYVSESPVTATVPDETVNLRVDRLPHYRMMPGNVWDGC